MAKIKREDMKLIRQSEIPGTIRRRGGSKYDEMFSSIPLGKAWVIENKTIATSVYQALLRRKKLGTHLNLESVLRKGIRYIINPK